MNRYRTPEEVDRAYHYASDRYCCAMTTSAFSFWYTLAQGCYNRYYEMYATAVDSDEEE